MSTPTIYKAFIAQLKNSALKGISEQALNGRLELKHIVAVAEQLLDNADNCVILTGSYTSSSSSILSDVDLYVVKNTEPDLGLNRELRIIDGIPCEINTVGSAFIKKMIGVTRSMRSGRTTPALTASILLVGSSELFHEVRLQASYACDIAGNELPITKIKESISYGLTVLLMDFVASKTKDTRIAISSHIYNTLIGLISLNFFGWIHSISYLSKFHHTAEPVSKHFSEIQNLYISVCNGEKPEKLFETALDHLNNLGGPKWAGHVDNTRIL